MPEALVLREIVENKKDEYLQEADQMEKRAGEGATKRFIFTEAGLYFETRKRTRKEDKEEDQEKEPNIKSTKQLEAAGNTKEYGGSITIVENYQQEQNLLHRELEEIEQGINQYNILIEDLQAQREELKKTLTMSSAIVLAEGYDDSIYIYNSETKNWQKFKVGLLFEGILGGAAILKEELYVFGSMDLDNNIRIRHYKLDGENEWHVLAEMNVKRDSIEKSTIVFNEEIWVIGGKIGINRTLKSVEKYNPETNSWTLMAELNHARASCAAVVIDNKIYVCGGWNETEESFLKSVEVYDPDENKWEIFCDLPFGLRNHSALADGTNLIIIGGRKSRDFVPKSKEVLKMDISNPTNNWEHLPDLIHECYCFHGAFKTEEGLMVCSDFFAGMFDGKEWRKRPGIRPIFPYVTIQLSKKDEELFLRKLCS